MTEEERLQLLSRLVEIDARIMEATTAAAWPSNNAQFESAMSEVGRLRAERARIQAQMDVV
jgi:hypothetical protein